jgi:predicted component of viral defense system (DUF524 family)
MTLKKFVLTPTEGAGNGATSLQQTDIRVRVAGTDLVSNEFTVADGVITVDELSEDITSAGVDVEVILKTEKDPAVYKYTLTNVNGSNPGTKFAKKVLKSVASIKAQDHGSRATTKFTFAVEKDSDNKPITDLVLYSKKGGTKLIALNTPISTVEEGSTLQLSNEESVQFIDAIGWGTFHGEAAAVEAVEAVCRNTDESVAVCPTEGLDLYTK